MTCGECARDGWGCAWRRCGSSRRAGTPWRRARNRRTSWRRCGSRRPWHRRSAAGFAVAGPPELRGEALGLSELGGRGCGVLDAPSLGSEGIRAARLTGIGDAQQVLQGLDELLGEVGIALVGVAMGADDEGVYWQCMEAIDAADESRDRVLEMLRRLAVREQSLPEPDSAAGSS